MDDEDEFLYGDEDQITYIKDPKSTTGSSKIENGEGESEEKEEAMDDESDESDLEIILDSNTAAPSRPPAENFRFSGVPQTTLRAPPPTSAPVLLPPTSSTAPPVNLRPTASLVPPGPAVSPSPAPSLTPDILSMAALEDNTTVIDVDIETLEPKPWRAPSAFASDFFNYGFDEKSWRAYCLKQKENRKSVGKEKSNPFSIFATVPLEDAWQTLAPEQKARMAQLSLSTMMPPMGFGMMPPQMMGMPGGDSMNGPMDMNGPRGMKRGRDGDAEDGHMGNNMPMGNNLNMNMGGNMNMPGNMGFDPNFNPGFSMPMGGMIPPGMDMNMMQGGPNHMQGNMGRGRGGRGGRGNNPFGANPNFGGRGRGGPPQGPQGGPDFNNNGPQGPMMVGPGFGGSMSPVPTQPGGLDQGERPPIPRRSASPLPANVPTGPKSNKAPPKGPRGSSYRDRDRDGESESSEYPDYDQPSSKRWAAEDEGRPSSGKRR